MADMHDPRRFTAPTLPFPNLLRRWLFLLAAAWISLLGCQSGKYKAENLPTAMRVPPAVRSHEINLANMASTGGGSSQIGAGDLVELTILSGTEEEPSDPIQARVSQEGTLAVPLVGEVNVAGIEPFEAGQRIATAALERGIYRQPSVVLKVEEQAVNRVTVIGAVDKPGTYELPRGSSDLLSAIAAAGGMTELASTKVEILRHGPQSFLAETEKSSGGVAAASYNESILPTPSAVDPQTLTANQLPSGPQVKTERIDLAAANPVQRTDYKLGDRDVVMVQPEDKRFIHVTGLVNKPDQFELPVDQDVRVLDAVAMAGGIKSPVADKVYVIRQLEGMAEPAVIQVSLADAKSNGDENLRLTSGDLVSVETTPLTNFVDTMTMFFRVGLGIGGNIAPF